MVVAGDRVTLLANEAPLGLVLSHLAFALGLEVTGVDAAADQSPVTLRIVDASVEEVLGASLAGRPFALHYAARDGRSTVAKVTLEEPPAVTAVEPNASPQGRSARRARRAEQRMKAAQRASAEAARLASLSAEEKRQLEAEQRRKREEAEAEQAASLASADAERRASAVASLDEARDVADLSHYLANDPSPRVRAAAAQALADVGTAAGIRSLVRALDDPDPSVVIEALDALQWIDDPSVLPEVRGMLRHRNPEVRELAADTIEWLEE